MIRQATDEEVTQVLAHRFLAIDCRALARLDQAAVKTRVHWVYIDEYGDCGDLDKWLAYCEEHFPGTDPEALDMALGLC